MTPISATASGAGAVSMPATVCRGADNRPASPQEAVDDAETLLDEPVDDDPVDAVDVEEDPESPLDAAPEDPVDSAFLAGVDEAPDLPDPDERESVR